MTFRLAFFRVLTAVAEEKSFSRAAERLGTTQPWISRCVREFEDQLGLALFLRSHSRTSAVELTPEGEVLFKHAKSLIENHNDFIATWRFLRNKEVELILGADAFTVLIPSRDSVIDKISKKFPTINLKIINYRNVEICEKLRKGEAHIGFITGRVPNEPELEFHFAENIPIDLLIPERHPLKDLAEIPSELLAGQDVLVAPASAHAMSLETRAFLEANGAIVHEAREGNRDACLREAQMKGYLAHSLRGSGDRSKIIPEMTLRPILGDPLYMACWFVKSRRPSLPHVNRIWESVILSAQ